MKTKHFEERDYFQSKWGFILASIGSAVGMGNIWRFPIMLSIFGGLTFLIPYILFIILIAGSGVVGEFSLGRIASAGPIGAFGWCTESKGNKKIGQIIGILPVLGSLALAIGYTVVVGWIYKYCFLSFHGDLFQLGTNMDAIGNTFNQTAPCANSWSESIHFLFHGNPGNPFWLIFGLVISFIIMAMGISGGIEKANKIMMPTLFFLFLGLAIYIYTLPGSKEGYQYIFTLNPSQLKDIRLWIFAFGQAFFSLSVAGNGSIIYGSYLSKNEDMMYSAKNVAFFDTLAALLAAFVIIPAMAVGGAELSSGGPGLMFVWLVNVFNGMPGGRIVECIFFSCVLFAAISSIVNLYEAPVAALQEVFHLKRIHACLIIATIGCIVSLSIQAITGQWMDAVSIYICPMGAAIAGFMFFWISKKENTIAAINTGAKKPVGDWIIWLGRIVYVPLTIIALIAGAILGGIG